MNVEETYKNDTPDWSPSSIAELISLRKVAFDAFAAREQKRGLITGITPLETSEGQDALRLYLMRFIEELYEAFDSHENGDVDFHTKEELIDAINYLWSAAIQVKAIDNVEFMDSFSTTISSYSGPSVSLSAKLSPWLIQTLTSLVCLQILPKLRNRSHMVNTQDAYFAHYAQFGHVLGLITLEIMLSGFGNWTDFYRMFMAKHDVLMFRIETGY